MKEELTAKEIEEKIFNDGITYGDDGASHKCEYTKEQRVKMIEDYRSNIINKIKEKRKELLVIKKDWTMEKTTRQLSKALMLQKLLNEIEL
jgi:hypothetical protein